jgi:hypothetical protein
MVTFRDKNSFFFWGVFAVPPAAIRVSWVVLTEGGRTRSKALNRQWNKCMWPPPSSCSHFICSPIQAVIAKRPFKGPLFPYLSAPLESQHTWHFAPSFHTLVSLLHGDWGSKSQIHRRQYVHSYHCETPNLALISDSHWLNTPQHVHGQTSGTTQTHTNLYYTLQRT